MGKGQKGKFKIKTDKEILTEISREDSVKTTV